MVHFGGATLRSSWDIDDSVELGKVVYGNTLQYDAVRCAIFSVSSAGRGDGRVHCSFIPGWAPNAVTRCVEWHGLYDSG